MAVLGDLAASRVRRSSNVVSRVVADEAIVVPIRRGAADLDSIYTFNESGTKLWSLIENGLDPAAVGFLSPIRIRAYLRPRPLRTRKHL